MEEASGRVLARVNEEFIPVEEFDRNQGVDLGLEGQRGG